MRTARAKRAAPGWGLAIVKHIISRHRGRLRIESEIGQGSRFTVLLPEAAGRG
jgi:two-component system phosphate regulon sensor histidine kinase PhoR